MIFRTDLAKEACKGLENTDGLDSEEFISFGINGSRVRISSDGASRKTGKRKGEYVSFETDAVNSRDAENYENISRAIAEEIRKMIKNPHGAVLVAGLGNDRMTPDSVGPKAAKNILVTKHIFEFMPAAADERMNPVCAIAPGVLGVTGIESADIIKGICKENDIGAVIVIDALAARKSERMFSTFQITDAGIEPGAGVGNKRSALNNETLGVPVIAIGVPTVVDAATVANDSIEILIENIKKYASEDSSLKKSISVFENDNRYVLIKEVLSPYVGELVVTPKEVDLVIDDVSKIIANAINDVMTGENQNMKNVL